MKAKFLDYLSIIGAATKTLSERVETVYDFYEQVCPEEITDIFVTDYLDEEGRREFENLWFFLRRSLWRQNAF